MSPLLQNAGLPVFLSQVQSATNDICFVLACYKQVIDFILMECCLVVALVIPPDPGTPPSLLAGWRTKLCLAKSADINWQLWIARVCFCDCEWMQTNACVLCCTVTAVVDVPAKISAGDTVMENGWMDGWIFKDLRYLHITDSSSGMLVCWSLRRCCRFVVRVWSDVWPHSFLITGSDLLLNVSLLTLLLYLLFLLLCLW